MQEIMNRFDSKQEAVDALASVLSISRESGYRRMRNTTMLSPEELKKLCLHFGISMDNHIHNQPGNIIFNFYQLVTPIRDFDSFLDQLLINLRTALQISDPMIYYATEEISVFQYFYFPELAAFKLYAYGITVWEIEMLENRKCSMELFSPMVLDKAKECTRLYALLPSMDLWSYDILKHSLNQIEFLAETDRFDPPEMALTVCDQLYKLMERQEEMASIGRKFFRTSLDADNYGEFQLYYNELVHTNNTILLKSPTIRMLFTTFSNPNFLRTSNPATCDYFEKWFERTIRRSTAISVHSEKYRSQFFNRLKKQVQQLRRKIELLRD